MIAPGHRAEKEARILAVVLRACNQYSEDCFGRLPEGSAPRTLGRMNTDHSPGSVLSSLWQQIRAVLDLVLDLSFKRLVTPRLVRTLYVLNLLGAVLYGLQLLFSGFWGLVTAPVAFLLYLIVSRVMVELILTFFRIADKLAPLTDESAAKSVQNPSP